MNYRPVKYSTQGYRRNSPDLNKPTNLINSGRISMSNVDFPVIGIDNLGNRKVMYPNEEHQFKGSQVLELPVKQDGGFSSIPLFTNSILQALSQKVENSRQQQYQSRNLANPLSSIPMFNQTDDYTLKGVQNFQDGGSFDEGDDFTDDSYLWEDDQPDNSPQPAQQEVQAEPATTEDEPVPIDYSIWDEAPATMQPPTAEVREGTQPQWSTPVMDSNSSDVESNATKYLIGKGLQPHIAAGIIGNLVQESGLKPDSSQKNGNGRGIAQWDVRNRYQDMKKFAQSTGRNYNDLYTQLDYVLQEASDRGDLTKVLASKTASEAAYLFAHHYERPAKIEPIRMHNAERIFNSIK